LPPEEFLSDKPFDPLCPLLGLKSIEITNLRHSVRAESVRINASRNCRDRPHLTGRAGLGVKVLVRHLGEKVLGPRALSFPAGEAVRQFVEPKTKRTWPIAIFCDLRPQIISIYFTI